MDKHRHRRWLVAHDTRHRLVGPLAARFGDGAEDLADIAMERCAGMELGDESQAPYVMWRIAWGLGIDAHRREQTARKYAPQLVTATSSASAEDIYLDRELGRRAVAAVNRLAPDKRDALLAVADGLTAEEIARKLGRSVDAVKHLIARGRAQVRKQLLDAELALLGLRARYRRYRESRSVDPATLAVTADALLPAVAAAAAVVLAFALATHTTHEPSYAAQQPSATAPPATVTDRSDEWARPVRWTSAAPQHASGSSADPLSRAYPDFTQRIDQTLDDAPKTPPARKGVPGGRGVGARPGGIEYEPDADDPVGDLGYCLTHPVVSPTSVGCEEPPPRRG